MGATEPERIDSDEIAAFVRQGQVTFAQSVFCAFMCGALAVHVGGAWYWLLAGVAALVGALGWWWLSALRNYATASVNLARAEGRLEGLRGRSM